jgi:hypothetical protein
MSYIRRTTALAVAAFILFVAFPVLAKTPTHHQHTRVLMQAGYAATVITNVDSSRDCDMPSSGCVNGTSISN